MFQTVSAGDSQTEKYFLRVGEVEITAQNKDNIVPEGLTSGTISYDPDTQTLTLDNVHIEQTGYTDSVQQHYIRCTPSSDPPAGSSDYFTGDLTVQIKGENVIDISELKYLYDESGLDVSGIYNHAGDIVIEGNNPAEDSLTLFTSGDGIYAVTGAVYIRYAGLKINPALYHKGIDAETGIYIENSNLDIRTSGSECGGLYVGGTTNAEENIEITNSTVKVSVENYDALSTDDRIIITDSIVEVESFGTGLATWMDDVQISGSYVDITSRDSNAIWMDTGNAVIENSVVFVQAVDEYDGIYAGGGGSSAESSWITSSSAYDQYETITNSVVIKDTEGIIDGDVTLPYDAKVPSGSSLTIPEGTSLTIPEGITLTVEEGATLTVDGTLTVNGELVNNGTVIRNDLPDEPEPEEEPDEPLPIDATPPDYILNGGGTETFQPGTPGSPLSDGADGMTITLTRQDLSHLMVYRREGVLFDGWRADVYLPGAAVKALYTGHLHGCDIVFRFTPADNPDGSSRPAYRVELVCVRDGIETPVTLAAPLAVTFHYNLSPGQAAEKVAAVALDADGDCVPVEGAVYKNGKLTFALYASGVYGVGYGG